MPSWLDWQQSVRAVVDRAGPPATAATPAAKSLLQQKLATKKFNFLAWVACKDDEINLNATDLMILVQLVVRHDPSHHKLTIGGPALAHRTGVALSGVRESVKKLAGLGLLDVAKRSGRSSCYTVRIDEAPPNWIKRQTQAYEREQQERHVDQSTGADKQPPTAKLAGSRIGIPGGESAEHLAVIPPKASTGPHQDSGTIYSFSDNYNSNSLSKGRPKGRGREIAFAEEEKNKPNELGSAGPSIQSSPRRGPRGAPASPNAKVGPQSSTNAADTSFDRFVRAWPKIDKQPDKLKGAWIKYVIIANVDVETVIEAAQQLARYHSVHQEKYLHPAGAWLKARGWTKPVPKLSRNDEEMANYFTLVNAAVDGRTTPEDEEIKDDDSEIIKLVKEQIRAKRDGELDFADDENEL